jgi:hypothetical protein
MEKNLIGFSGLGGKTVSRFAMYVNSEQTAGSQLIVV